MKRTALVFLLLTFQLACFAQLGVGTTTPDPSAMLDVFSNNKGLLPPRMELVAVNNSAPVTNPATGLVVYNTATSGSGVNSVTPGYYYWTGSAWFSLSVKGKNIGDLLYWNGSQWLVIPIGSNGSVLTVCNGIPTWGGCEVTTEIKPANNPTETYVYSYFPNNTGWGTNQLPIMAWTHNGTPSVARAFIKFDYTVPAGSTILTAKLFLYAATPNPNSGNLIDAHYGSGNDFLVQRVTSSWTNAGATWNNPATVTNTNQVTAPQAISSTQNDTLDVTQLVKDMQINGNYGFSLRLVAENYYNSRQYFSSYAADPAKRPKLVITYKP